MTGVDGRPELIFEGSNDDKNYIEYEFHYKPGNLKAAPKWANPH